MDEFFNKLQETIEKMSAQQEAMAKQLDLLMSHEYTSRETACSDCGRYFIHRQDCRWWEDNKYHR